MKKVLIGFVILILAVVMAVIVLLKAPILTRHSPEIQVKLSNPDDLMKHVLTLSSTPLPRNHKNVETLDQVAEYIARHLASVGIAPSYQVYKVNSNFYKNVVARIGPKEGKLIVVGAHYDVAGDQPGADDNATGVAGVLEIAKHLKKMDQQLKQPVEFVFYTLEEPPHFRTKNMGSYQHIQNLIANQEEVEMMFCLEMIGYFTDEENTQGFPIGALNMIYPTTGNFTALVGRYADWGMIRDIKKVFRETSPMMIESLTGTGQIRGVDFSDHLNYWAEDIPAFMFTDTAFFRNDQYHEVGDTADRLDFKRMAQVTEGILGVVTEFATTER